MDPQGEKDFVTIGSVHVEGSVAEFETHRVDGLLGEMKIFTRELTYEQVLYDYGTGGTRFY